MNKVSKILISLLTVGIVMAGSIFIIRRDILENDNSTKITISENIKNKIYNSSEEIILNGTANPKSEIIISLNGELGLIESNQKGKWAINLGRMPEGEYNFQVLSTDSPGVESIATTQIVINDKIINKDTRISFFQNFANFFTASLYLNSKIIPDRLIIIPKTTPDVLQGNWNLLN